MVSPLHRVAPFQERARIALIAPFRKPRATPRANGATEDPAPDWVWQTIDAILAISKAENDKGYGLAYRALQWCLRGDAEVRAQRLRDLLALWVGERGPMLHLFLTNAEETNAGPRKIPDMQRRGLVIAIGSSTATVLIDGEDKPRAFPHDEILPIRMREPATLRREDRVRLMSDDPGEPVEHAPVQEVTIVAVKP